MERLLDLSGDEWEKIIVKEAFFRDVEGPQSLEDTSWIGPYERVYMERNFMMLQEYRSALQFPPVGPITYKDLKWQYGVPNPSAEYLNTNNCSGASATTVGIAFEAGEDVGRKSESAKDSVERRTLIAYIPWDRVDDFVTGETRHRSDVHTNFLKRPKGKGPGKKPRHNTGLVTYWYECQYGPKDLSGRVMEITPDMETQRPRYDVKGNLLQNGLGHSQKRITRARNGGSLKKGCVCKFQVKRLYYLRDIAEIVYYNPRHENENRLIVHGTVSHGDRGRFEKQLPPGLRLWLLNCLRQGLSSDRILRTHRTQVMKLVAQGVPPERCHFLREWDVRNIAKCLRKTEYERHKNDAESVKLWVQSNPELVFFYQETKRGPFAGTLTADNVPFVIGIQNEFQFTKMLRHGHESIVAMDATFGTNHWKYPLYTLMVFDKWRNGVPVAFIVTQRSTQADISPWLGALRVKLVSKMPEWRPNAFIVDDAQAEINALIEVFPRISVFLCLWHVRRAWQKNACSKIKCVTTRALALRELGALMYIEESPFSSMTVLQYVYAQFQALRSLVSGAQAFWAYVEKHWMGKTEMWVTGNRHIPHAGQDTNAGIESYHGNTKAVLKADKARLNGRRLDWLIHELTHDVITKYDYDDYMKEHGFITNKKAERIVMNSIIQAKKIPDHCVLLPRVPGEPALVSSRKRPHLRYAVHNPDTEWGCCECVYAQKGNLCKHQLKVLWMMRPDLADGTIVKVCGTLYGTKLGGVSALMHPGQDSGNGPSLCRPETDHDMNPLDDGQDVSGMPQSPSTIADDDLKLTTTIEDIGRQIIERADKHYLIKKHLAADFTEMNTRHAAIEVQIETGIIHPLEMEAAMFHRNDPDTKNSLTRIPDFLGGRAGSSRRTRKRET